MSKYLMILEVSRKQDYIFGRKELKENIRRSIEIALVTGSEFFKAAAGGDYGEENMVYSGGGHTVLQFDDCEQARRFAQKVTEKAMRDYEGMEIFVKLLEYDQERTPGENLKALSAALEKKKALRLASFCSTGFGVEKLSDHFVPVRNSKKASSGKRTDIIDPPDGYVFPTDFKEVAGEDNFLAVVHIDGNGMGERVNRIYQREDCKDWDTCVAVLRSFSNGIQTDFEMAFREMIEELPKAEGEKTLPLRPVILAGDDVCFVTRGTLGLECARVFLEKLCTKENEEQPGQPYAACAGIAMVHTKYPFYRAYTLAEELCTNAKRFGAELDETGRISAMDWHIEFGQVKEDLETIREDYVAEDGRSLTLRPVAVHSPEVKIASERTYGYFKNKCRELTEAGNGRNVWKGLRTALRQGKVESEYYLAFRQVELDPAFDKVGSEERCLCFDTIEMMDHVTFFPEVDKK